MMVASWGIRPLGGLSILLYIEIKLLVRFSILEVRAIFQLDVFLSSSLLLLRFYLSVWVSSFLVASCSSLLLPFFSSFLLASCSSSLRFFFPSCLMSLFSSSSFFFFYMFSVLLFFFSFFCEV